MASEYFSVIIRPVQSTAFLFLVEFLSLFLSFFLCFFVSFSTPTLDVNARRALRTVLNSSLRVKVYELHNYVSCTGQRQQLLANMTYICIFALFYCQRYHRKHHSYIERLGSLIFYYLLREKDRIQWYLS